MTVWHRLLRRRALERELDAELRDHIEREIADRVRAGESEADVRRQMRLTSGGLDQVKEACRDVRRPRALADLGADVRFAWRILARNGWATAGAILTLALAMGVANATFISTYANLWRDFPFERPDRIAIMRTVDARGREAGLSFADYQNGAATRGYSTARRPPLRSAPSAWAATVPHPSSSKDCMCRPTRSPCSASSPRSVATSRRPTIVLAPNPWRSFRATSGRAATRQAATCWDVRSR